MEPGKRAKRKPAPQALQGRTEQKSLANRLEEKQDLNCTF